MGESTRGILNLNPSYRFDSCKVCVGRRAGFLGHLLWRRCSWWRDDVGIPKNLKHTFWRICELCMSKLQSSFFSTKKIDTSLHLQRHGALAAEAIQPREGFFFLCVNCAHFLCAPVSPPQLLSRTELRHLYLCRRVFDSCSVNLTLYVI